MIEEREDKGGEPSKRLNMSLLFGPLLIQFILPLLGTVKLLDNLVGFIIVNYLGGFYSFFLVIPLMVVIPSRKFRQAATSFMIGWTLPFIFFCVLVLFFLKPDT